MQGQLNSEYHDDAPPRAGPSGTQRHSIGHAARHLLSPRKQAIYALAGGAWRF